MGFIALIAATFLQGEVESMKLVEMKHNQVLVEFKDDVVIIHDQIIEQDIKKRGIFIPPAYRSEYDGKTTIKIGDPDFQRAFKEVYYAFTFKDKSLYRILEN